MAASLKSYVFSCADNVFHRLFARTCLDGLSPVDRAAAECAAGTCARCRAGLCITAQSACCEAAP